jgi:autotransporter translocation and assembly factor TamB
MTTKKIVVIVVSVLLGISLVVVLFSAGLVGYVLYSFGKSDAASAAKSYLRSNDKLKQDIGDIKDFGTFVTGSINVQDSAGGARLKLKVIGTNKTVDATVDLTYRRDRSWHVVGASYVNDQGHLVELLNPYESALVTIPLAA